MLARTNILCTRFGMFFVASMMMLSSTALPLLALDATSADNLANAVVGALGYSKGFCAIPNSGNGQLARAFLQRSGMKVHAMDAAQANVDATRLLIEQNSLVSVRFICDKGTLAVMPYADRFADLIVITNLTDADLASVSYAEIERALTPGGQAWIGRATSEGAGITAAALQTWMGAVKRRSTAAASTAQGTWVVITGLELTGVDTWPRRARDAAGTRSSHDSVASFPWLPQARLKPYSHNKGTLVASGGKMYMAFPDYNVSGSANWLRAYNIYNGELLWQRDLSGDGVSSLTSDFMTAAPWGVYVRGTGTIQLDGNTGVVVSPQTAVPADNPGPLFSGTGYGYGCGPYTATPKLFLKQMYAFGYDRVNGRNLICHPYKTPCDIGVQISNGFSIFAANFCGCNFTPGTMLEAPAGSFQFDRAAAADGADRLEKGPAWNAVSATVVPDARDWPTYRSTNTRNGTSAASVPATAAAPGLLWNCRPAVNYVTVTTTKFFDYLPEQGPTAPVVAGRYTFFGGTDGYIRCVDNSNGQLKWSYGTGGRIFTAPAVAQGCVYAGAADGWAYCLEAHTGRLVWRFRAAPVDRRFNLYGHLSSTWPVLGGVTVQDGKAYFCGGFQSEYGSHLYCVDALTGALVWQNNSGGTSYIAAGRLGFSPEGPMAVIGSKLVANSAAAPMATFSMATGAQDATPTEFTSNGTFMSGYSFGWANFAREIGVLDATHVFAGGLWAFSDARDRNGGWQKAKTYWFHKTDATGKVLYPQISLASNMWTGPAWDGTDFFATMNNSKDLIKASVSGVAAAVDGGFAANPGVVSADPNYAPSAQWTRNGININAIALSPSGIVAAYTKTDLDVSSVSPAPEVVSWYVGVLNRSTGATIWETALPDVGTGLKGEPLVQGLAIDRNGNIIVMQRNGNVLCYGNTAVNVVRNLTTSPRQAVTPDTPLPQGEGKTATASIAVEQVVPAIRHGNASLVSDPSTRPVTQPMASGPDTSDMITLATGARVHVMPPELRTDRPKSNPADMSWKPQAPCIAVTAVLASSSSGSANGARNTIDRDLRTRWSPAGSGEQWVTYDLGSLREVSAVSMVWFSAKQQTMPFAVQVSGDGKEYRTVDSGTLVGKGTSESLRTFLTQTARYVRLTFASPSYETLLGLEEVGLHGPVTTGMR